MDVWVRGVTAVRWVRVSSHARIMDKLAVSRRAYRRQVCEMNRYLLGRIVDIDAIVLIVGTTHVPTDCVFPVRKLAGDSEKVCVTDNINEHWQTREIGLERVLCRKRGDATVGSSYRSAPPKIHLDQLAILNLFAYG